MGRVKEQPRGRLAVIQDLLSGGSRALVDGAQTLSGEMQRRLVEVGRGVEGQVATLIGAVEERLSERLDVLLDRLAVTLRRDVERVRDRVRIIENRLADVPKEGVRELIGPLQAIASGAAERASGALARIEELGLRLQNIERRAAEFSRDTARETLDADELRQRLERMEQRLTDLGREVGTKLGELGALRDRLTRIESRLGDLSKEQLARAVESAGLRERLFRLEQRSPIPGPAAVYSDPEAARVPVED